MIKIRKNLLIGVDLGTYSTKVYVKDRGVIEEIPTVIAFNKRNRTVISLGEEAKKMIGRNPAHIEVIRPVNYGTVVHFDEALIFLEMILENIKKNFLTLGSILVIGIPLHLTEVQKKGVIDVGYGAGMKSVYLIEEPLAAALGANLDVEEARGILICDIGGGTTDIALISMGGIVIGRSIKIGGDTFNQSIVSYLKSKYGLLIGEGQAEEARISIGSIVNKNEKTFLLKGRDILTGLPKEIDFTTQDLKESIYENLEEISLVLKDIINLAPPDLLGDITESGIYLSGGGSLIEGLDGLFEKELKLKINLVDEPRYAVVRGLGKILEDFNHFKKILINV